MRPIDKSGHFFQQGFLSTTLCKKSCKWVPLRTPGIEKHEIDEEYFARVWKQFDFYTVYQ